MKKQFVCKIDGSVFQTKEELISYMLDRYSFEEEGGETANIFNELKSAFPFAEIDVKKLDKNQRNRSGDYQVKMNWEPKYDADFFFFLGETNNYTSYHYQFVDVESAISFYSTFLEQKDVVIEKMNKRFSIEKILINQMYEGTDYTSPGISFTFTINGKDYHEHYLLGTDPISFVERFDGYFNAVVEGDVSIETDVSTSSDVEYWIGNVPMSLIVKRAKRIKIEILKER